LVSSPRSHHQLHEEDTVLVRFDPFRDLDRLVEAATAAPRSIPMDAVRRGDRLVVSFDLPGVAPDAVDLTVERNQLTLTVERARARQEGDEQLVAERPAGRATRQLLLGENLDTDRIEASFEHGVLTVTIPVAEQAKPRKVAIGGSAPQAEAIEAGSTPAPGT
jgi:HSP20 family protein